MWKSKIIYVASKKIFYKEAVNKLDIRTQTTQTNFKRALLKCMAQKPFSELRTKDVIISSGMSSRTFYQYYKDNNALLADLENDLYQEFQKALVADRKAVAKRKKSLTQSNLVKLAEKVAKNTVNFFIRDRQVLELLTSDHGDIRFINHLVELSNQEFSLRLAKLNPHYQEVLAKEQSIPAGEVLYIFDSNIINVILQLIRYNDQLSPADMRQYICNYLTSTPLQFLGLLPKKRSQSLSD